VESSIAIGVGCDPCLLADPHLGHVGFIDIDADAQDVIVGDGEDRRFRAVGYTLAGLEVFAQDDT
jgi:hypothetical protein